MASGVKNLRAMFEQKQEESTSSPPSRGRSPVGSNIISIRSGSSRPVSKIRTSFVAVERSGSQGVIFGLRRKSDVQEKAMEDGNSTRPVITRTASNADAENIIEETESVKDQETHKQDTKIEELVEEPNETEKVANGIGKTDQEVKAAIQKPTEPNPIVDGVDVDDGKAEEAVEKPKEPETKINGTSKVGEDSTNIKGKAKEIKGAIEQSQKATQVASKPEDSELGSSGSFGSTIKNQSTASKELPDKPKIDVKNPATSDAKVSTNTTRSTTINPRSSDVKTPTSATKAPVKRDTISKPQSRISTPRTSLLPSSRPLKTKPKSPTRPGRLPAAATASTASSAAKTASEEPSSARPAKPKPRTSTDGDFLARMMRPTASSSKKTHDKNAPKTTPPRNAGLKIRRLGSVRTSKSGSNATNENVQSSDDVLEHGSPDQLHGSQNLGSPVTNGLESSVKEEFETELTVPDAIPEAGDNQDSAVNGKSLEVDGNGQGDGRAEIKAETTPLPQRIVESEESS